MSLFGSIRSVTIGVAGLCTVVATSPPNVVSEFGGRFLSVGTRNRFYSSALVQQSNLAPEGAASPSADAGKNVADKNAKNGPT